MVLAVFPSVLPPTTRCPFSDTLTGGFDPPLTWPTLLGPPSSILEGVFSRGTGLLNTSRQMDHEKFSEQEVLAEAIPRHRQQGLRVDDFTWFLNFSNSMTGRQHLTPPKLCCFIHLIVYSVSQTICSRISFIPSWNRAPFTSGNSVFLEP